MKQQHIILLIILVAIIGLVLLSSKCMINESFAIDAVCNNNKQCNGNPPLYKSRSDKAVAEYCDIPCSIKNGVSVCSPSGKCAKK